MGYLALVAMVVACAAIVLRAPVSSPTSKAKATATRGGKTSSSPLRRLILAQERGALTRAIESLPLKYRLPLMLRYFSEYDYGAIAEALGVTRNQVGTLLFRAKRMLRVRLLEPGQPGQPEKREKSEKVS